MSEIPKKLMPSPTSLMQTSVSAVTSMNLPVVNVWDSKRSTVKVPLAYVNVDIPGELKSFFGVKGEVGQDVRGKEGWKKSRKSNDNTKLVKKCLFLKNGHVCMYRGRPLWNYPLLLAKGRDPSGSWVQNPNPAVPTIPRHSRWLTHLCALSEPTLL